MLKLTLLKLPTRLHHLTERLGTRDKAGTEHKKVALLHFRTPLRVRVRATVKLSSAALFHDESSIKGRGVVQKCNSTKKVMPFQISRSEIIYFQVTMVKLITNR